MSVSLGLSPWEGSQESQVQETEIGCPCRECAVHIPEQFSWEQKGASFSGTEKQRSKWRPLSLVCAPHQCSAVSWPGRKVNRDCVISRYFMAVTIHLHFMEEIFISFLFRQRAEKSHGRTGK